MPYKTIADLPDNVKNVLPEAAQKVWMKVYNDNIDADDQEKAPKIAWTVVKNGWEKQEDDWVRKNSMNRTHETAGCIEFNKQGDVLEFTGVGFKDGTWHGIDGHKTEYTRELVEANAKKFAMRRIKSMNLSVHGKTDKDVIGWVTTQRLLADGHIIVGGYVFDQEEIKFLEQRKLEGGDIGISPEFMAPSTYDPQRNLYKAYALDVTGYCFVDNPACKVCYVGDTRLLSEKEKKKDMSNTGELTAEQIEEIKTFYGGQLAEGKTFEEIKAGLVVAPELPVPPALPVEDPPAEVPGAETPAAIPAVLDEASQLRLNEAIEAAEKIEKWEAGNRAREATGVETLVGEIKEIDATFNAERMLAHFGDDPYAKSAFLNDYKAQRTHDIENLPEPERQLAGPIKEDEMKELAESFGVEYVAGMTQDDLVTKGAEALI